MCKKKKVCRYCLGLQNNDGSHKCPPHLKRYYCNKHEVSRNLCKCTRFNVMNNATVNKCVLGQIGFQSEIITVRSQNKSKRVIVTFDCFALHSSMSSELKDEF